MIPKPAPETRDPETTSVTAGSEPESALIARAREDAAAFGQLYRRHYAAIQRYLRRRIGDASVVDGLVAGPFVAAQRHFGSYRDRGLPFRAWLYRLATSRLHRWLRSRRWRRLLRLDAEPAVEPRDDDRTAVRGALLELPARLQ